MARQLALDDFYEAALTDLAQEGELYCEFDGIALLTRRRSRHTLARELCRWQAPLILGP